MKFILKLEELAQLGLAIFLFSQLEFSWWWFFGLFLAPDIGMLGYLFGPKIGAYSYNLFHHKGLAIALIFAGYYGFGQWVHLAGIMLWAHAAFDRILGYGLKYTVGFKHTHLGELGK